MYEQGSHSLLNRILDQLNPEIRKRDLRHFYTRLGAQALDDRTTYRLTGEALENLAEP